MTTYPQVNGAGQAGAEIITRGWDEPYPLGEGWALYFTPVTGRPKEYNLVEFRKGEGDAAVLVLSPPVETEDAPANGSGIIFGCFDPSNCGLHP